MDRESARAGGQEQVGLQGDSLGGPRVWLQSPGKAALPEQGQGFQVAVEQLQPKTPGQPRALETVLLQECHALKAQLRQSEALAQERERERTLQAEGHQHTREQLRRAEASVHVLEGSRDLYQEKYRAALGRVGDLESQRHRLPGEAMRLWSSSQAEGDPSLGRLRAREVGRAMQLTGRPEQKPQHLQGQLAASHGELLQQKVTATTSLRRGFASCPWTHSCSRAERRKQAVSQATLSQKLRQQAEAYQAMVRELKAQLAREAEQNSSTLKDVARLELAVRSLCAEAAPEQALLEQTLQPRGQEEWPGKLLRAKGSIFWDRDHPLNAASTEAKQGPAASQPGGGPVLQLRGPKSPEPPRKAALLAAQDQPAERGLELQHLGEVGCPLEVLLGTGCPAGAVLERKSFLGGDGLPAAAAAATSARDLMEELMGELSRSKREPVQGLEMLRQQLQQAERRAREQRAESRSLREQLTKQAAALGLVRGRFRQARLQLQHQTAVIESLRVSLEVSRAGHHWLHQESERVMSDVHQWVEEQKQVNEELGHKLRAQTKQLARLTGERDLLQQLLERLQEDHQQLKNEANQKRMVCERIQASSARNHQALRSSEDVEAQAVLQQLWHVLLC